MAAILIKARPGVYGRQATEHERKLLEQFAEDYVASTSTRSATDVAILKKLSAEMLNDPLIGRASLGALPEVAVGTESGGENSKESAGTRSPRKTPVTVSVTKTAGKHSTGHAANAPNKR
ncbi:hypothetical protein [Bordetella sp. LUAb4]|uniref:hypothetical protein n=1 Tax=Bordetella sp. LUAb4 TaxID=2843195 RepID=UPI001E5CD2C8|nr:hypothetical protein [Bordetella sp. LUAb4]